jgi:hypothetical protein
LRDLTGLVWLVERRRHTDLQITGMGMERPGTISAIVLTKTPLVLADRYSGVNPLGVLKLEGHGPHPRAHFPTPREVRFPTPREVRFALVAENLHPLPPPAQAYDICTL